jgi:predicted nucleic acid-binding protein
MGGNGYFLVHVARVAIRPCDHDRRAPTGLALAAAHRLSIYGAMIAVSALGAGCDTLWSEDLQHAAVIGRRLRIINPFR